MTPPAIQEPELRTPPVGSRFSDSVLARVGTRLLDYDIKEILGEGGLGTVYRAKSLATGASVAIKILHARHAANPDAVGRYFETAMAATHLGHPNIAQVIDRGVTPDGAPFVIREYLNGESLHDCLQRVHRLPLFEAVNLAKQVARALGDAHALGITHRDLKPSNIYLCKQVGRRRIVRRTRDARIRFTVVPEESFDLVRLLDFGGDGFFDLSPDTRVSIDELHGLPHTRAPEQIQGRPADPRSDIYALGAVLYEMITGFPPFGGDTVGRVLRAHLSDSVILPSRRFPDAQIGLRLDGVILKCLQRNPLMRFARTDELCALLDGCVTDSAFLRDAHRLPGIKCSGIDLTQASPDARHASPPLDEPPAPAEPTPAPPSVGRSVETVVKEATSFFPVASPIAMDVKPSAPSVTITPPEEVVTPPASPVAAELPKGGFSTAAPSPTLMPTAAPPQAPPATGTSPTPLVRTRPRRSWALLLGCILFAEAAAAVLWITHDRWMHLVTPPPPPALPAAVVAAPPVVPVAPPAPPPSMPSPAPAPAEAVAPVEPEPAKAEPAATAEEPVQPRKPTVAPARGSKKLAVAKVKSARKRPVHRHRVKTAPSPIRERPAPAAVETVEQAPTPPSSPTSP